ncbi:MAG: hypothetical protein HY020_15325 [Burkholderiales bacterium]|nr:hypothetical protein [Burkholderiales bacterium]
MKHTCCHCGNALHWWNLKSSFECPLCSRALRANVAGPWVATFVLWTIAEAIIFVVLPAGEFAELLFRTVLSLLAGATVGWVVFGTLSRVAAAAEVTER